jgi:type VI secretion system secreted protein VgrG
MVQATVVKRLVKVVTALKDELSFMALDGSDGLSRNGEFRVSVLSFRGDIKADELLGKSVSVVLTTPHATQREFNGLAAGFFQLGAQGRYHRYLIVVRPWTWLLTRTSDCRIFQDQTVREVIEEVLKDHPYADFEFQLTASYRKWSYCVQYRETDFNFLARLMEQEGMHFFFRHRKGKHTLVIADGPKAHVAATHYESVAYLDPEVAAARQEEGVRHWSHGCEIQPTSFMTRDFNFEKPRADMQADAAPARPLGHEYKEAFEIFDYPGEYDEPGEGQQYARLRVEEMRHQFDLFNGESNAHGLASGGVFKLTCHPRADQNQEYLIVGADYQLEESPHESDSGDGEVFSVRFRAIPSTQTFQAPRLTPKPAVQGPQTAIVVGASGEEIHTDKYGRVKVQFHWDRYGNNDENSSCWIRVAQNWAGQNWGMIAIPRVGQEVIVDFLEGDPDQPIITGRVYNADQMPPYDLPANMTQTGIKSRSSQGGGVGNFNEIRFEDKTGSEHLLIHAEKDQMIEVENDETHSVGHDRKKTVDNDETTEVKNNRTETVGNDETITVNNHRKKTVQGNEVTSITGNRVETVQGNESVEVTGKLAHTITGAATYTSTTSITLTVGGSTVEIKPQQITLTFGASSIKIDAMGIALMAPKISLNG